MSKTKKELFGFTHLTWCSVLTRIIILFKWVNGYQELLCDNVPTRRSSMNSKGEPDGMKKLTPYLEVAR